MFTALLAGMVKLMCSFVVLEAYHNMLFAYRSMLLAYYSMLLAYYGFSLTFFFLGAQAAALRARHRGLLVELRPDAVALVDAFGYEDYALNSALGRWVRGHK